MKDFSLDEEGPRGPSGAFDRALTAIENVLVLVAGFVVIVLMMVVTGDVISRSLFNYPLPNSYEYMELGMVFAVYLGASEVQRDKRHVAIDAISSRLPPRGQAAIEMLGCFIGLVLMIGIGYWGTLAAWSSYVTGEYIGSVAHVPVLPARLALLVGVAVLSLRLILDICRAFRAMIAPAASQTPA